MHLLTRVELTWNQASAQAVWGEVSLSLLPVVNKSSTVSFEDRCLQSIEGVWITC